MKCHPGCPKNCPGNLPPALGPVIPHPVKDLLEGLGYDLHEYYNSLAGFPGLPSWTDFQLMLEGRKPMPIDLECYIWRKAFLSYGWSWQIIGGLGGGKLKGRCMRSDRKVIFIQELDGYKEEVEEGGRKETSGK